MLGQAAQPTLTPLGTLDAIHLATAQLWRDLRTARPVIATHDRALALAAQADGFTNVLSEPTRGMPEQRVIEWLRQNERDLAVDPVILGEVWFGIRLLPKGRRRARLEAWFDAGVRRLQCLPWEANTGLRWAELLDRPRSTGRAMPIKDSLIAATALVHDLVVVTRNRTDFEHARVRLLDPFTGL